MAQIGRFVHRTVDCVLQARRVRAFRGFRLIVLRDFFMGRALDEIMTTSPDSAEMFFV